MKLILVAMHLVACQPDLLVCQDMSVNTKRWSNIETCREDRDDEMFRLKQDLQEWAVVMSRCRYLIGSDRRSTPAF
ncbi:hypothetical protein [Labrenzia sp. DG1229]|uniref:hypothetical protein n=1 Tax=Labrenzia sp. DG1229 TaxID=681847 RepID=UPI00048CC04B|nr:hypothetical protein [Labrenzia sp. DG1229]